MRSRKSSDMRFPRVGGVIRGRVVHGISHVMTFEQFHLSSHSRHNQPTHRFTARHQLYSIRKFHKSPPYQTLVEIINSQPRQMVNVITVVQPYSTLALVWERVPGLYAVESTYLLDCGSTQTLNFEIVSLTRRRHFLSGSDLHNFWIQLVGWIAVPGTVLSLQGSDTVTAQQDHPRESRSKMSSKGSQGSANSQS
jgi:hypothetical protein